jgi:hypothetical protein
MAGTTVFDYFDVKRYPGHQCAKAGTHAERDAPAAHKFFLNVKEYQWN